MIKVIHTLCGNQIGWWDSDDLTPNVKIEAKYFRRMDGSTPKGHEPISDNICEFCKFPWQARHLFRVRPETLTEGYDVFTPEMAT